MADRDQRALERAWRERGTPNLGPALLTVRVRAGRLSPRARDLEGGPDCRFAAFLPALWPIADAGGTLCSAAAVSHFED